ncbi:MAG: hypothetical protein N3A59_06165 [Thermodesulfovibrionales bacterium]|nr:hypothetical protein [Thermodesulfovibrionales bacterium]
MPEALKSLPWIDFRPILKVFPLSFNWRDQFIYQLLIDRFNNGNTNIPPYDLENPSIGRDESEGER